MNEPLFGVMVSVETMALIWHATLYLLALLGPMIPAVAIYRLFPDTKVAVSGPLGGLTLKAGGAFAAYVATFALAIPLAQGFQRDIATLLHPYWTIVADIEVMADGKKIDDPRLLRDVKPLLKPDSVSTEGGRLIVMIPVAGDTWPLLSAEIEGWGAARESVQLKDAAQLAQMDHSAKEIRLRKPIVISKYEQSVVGR